MSFFFVDEPLSLDTPAQIGGETARHIGTVRRAKRGEEIEMQDPAGNRFVVRIEEVDKREIMVLPLRVAELPRQPERRISLLQANISEQKLDLILQKATELGAESIVIWQADHSPHAIPSDRAEHKLERFRAILTNACEQSGRPQVPDLSLAPNLAEAIDGRAGCVRLDAGAGRLALADADTAALIVGPEGGFSDEERTLCASRSIPAASIGTYTLRAETAAIAGLSVALSG